MVLFFFGQIGTVVCWKSRNIGNLFCVYMYRWRNLDMYIKNFREKLHQFQRLDWSQMKDMKIPFSIVETWNMLYPGIWKNTYFWKLFTVGSTSRKNIHVINMLKTTKYIFWQHKIRKIPICITRFRRRYVQDTVQTIKVLYKVLKHFFLLQKSGVLDL